MESRQSQQQDSRETISMELQLLVMSLLKGHVKSLTVVVSETGIVLRGDCDSFHAKQLVQEIVTKSSSLRIVSNDLIVDEHRPLS